MNNEIEEWVKSQKAREKITDRRSNYIFLGCICYWIVIFLIFGLVPDIESTIIQNADVIKSAYSKITLVLLSFFLIFRFEEAFRLIMTFTIMSIPLWPYIR